MSVFASLQVDSAISYVIAIFIPLLDAILPALPSETVIIALGVATAGSTDPRIALLIACAAAGAFLGDNLCYLLGRRFGPAVERRFFTKPTGRRTREWAQRSLSRFGTQLIIVCRFIPGGRTAVTLTCGLTGYPRRPFVVSTAIAAVIWVLYAFAIGRLGGRVFVDKPWAGLLIASGVTIVVSLVVEAVRRMLRARRGGAASLRHTRQVEADHAREDQPDGDELGRGYGVAEEEHAHGRRADGADAGPGRVGGPHL